MKRKKVGKYGIINHVFYEWYIKCCQAGIYPDGAILREQEAFNGWLEEFKRRFGLRQIRTIREAGDVPITTIKPCMEQLPEIIQGYYADDIRNMDELGLYFKAPLDTGLAKETKKCKGSKKSKE